MILFFSWAFKVDTAISREGIKMSKARDDFIMLYKELMDGSQGVQPKSPEAGDSTFPEKLRGAIDLRRKAFVHRTVKGCLFEKLALRAVCRQRNMNLGG